MRPAIILCLCIITTASAAVKDATPAPSFPCWCGADGSGTSASGLTLIDDLSKAKVVWKSDPIPGVYGSWISTGQSGPIIADGKVVVVYHDPNDTVADEDFVQKVLAEGNWKTKEYWDGTCYVDITKGEPAQREAFARKKFAKRDLDKALRKATTGN